MSTTRSARYHRARRARLIARLGGLCVNCSTPDALEIDHIHGGGNAQRRTLGNAREVTRLLALDQPALWEQVQLLCNSCHKAKTFALAGAL